MISILQLVEENLVNKAKNNNRDYSYFHASEWEKCHRKIAYEYYEAKKLIETDDSALKISPQLERIFDCGHYMHDRWRSYLEQTGALLGVWKCSNLAHKVILRKKIKDNGGRLANNDDRSEEDYLDGVFGKKHKLGILRPEKCDCGCTSFEYHEVGFYDEETMWGGHVDSILDVGLLDKEAKEDEKKIAVGFSAFPPKDWGLNKVVIDFKTMNPYKFAKLTEPLPEHKTQMQIYLYLSGLKYGKFIYEDKALQGVKEFLIVRDDNLLEVKIDQAKRLKFIVTHENKNGSRVLPKRAYSSRAHEECLRCKYRANCWKV